MTNQIDQSIDLFAGWLKIPFDGLIQQVGYKLLEATGIESLASR
jgi:hypothetical protein